MTKPLEIATLLWLAISKIAHDDVKSDDLVRLRKQPHSVKWHKGEVVEIVKFIDENWVWIGIGFIVNQPPSDIPV